MEREINEEKWVNRRLFLRLAGVTMGAVSLGLIPNNKVGLASEIVFPEPSCGGETKMDRKILVAYASEYGSTAGVAEAIGKELCNKGASVDVRLVKKLPLDLSTYQAAIVGSPIYRGKGMTDVVRFLQENSGTFEQDSCSLFRCLYDDAKPK